MTRGLKYWIVPALMLAFAVPAPAVAAGIELGNINLLYGWRQTDSKRWRPVDQTTVLGVEGSLGKPEWPLVFATDVYASGDTNREDTTKTETRRIEAAIGLRKIWVTKFVRPYFGAGVSILEDRLTVSDVGSHVSERDNTTGIWFGGGVFFRIGSHFDVGLAVRYLAANSVRLTGLPINASAVTGGVTVGWGWGEKKK